MRPNGAAPQDQVSKSPVEVLTDQAVLDCCASMSRLLGACSHPGFPVKQKQFIFDYLKSTASIIEQGALGQQRVEQRAQAPAEDEEAPPFQV